MFNFTYQDKKYRIAFEHVINPDLEQMVKWGIPQGIVGCTICTLFAVSEEKVLTQLAISRSCCKFPDNFDRKVGRKLALARLLKEYAKENKDFKTFVWDTYFEAIGKYNWLSTPILSRPQEWWFGTESKP